MPHKLRGVGANMNESRLARPLRQFCADVGIGITTAYEEIRAGRLVVAKVGAKTLVPDDRGREWLRSREVAAVAPSRNPQGKRGRLA
jgi:hypothetical protein